MKNHFILLLLIIAICAAGCGVYHPMTVDVPLISEKNDLRIDAGGAVFPSGFTTVSYGLTDKIAVQGFGTVGFNGRYYVQAAAGLYQKKEDDKVMEFYGGYGFGYGDVYNYRKPGDFFGNYQLYFGQINYGKIANGSSAYFEGGFGFKGGYMLSAFTDKYYYDKVLETNVFKTYHDQSLLLEPVGFIRVGGNLKFSAKIGGTLIYKFTSKDKQLPYSFFNIGLGINYRF